MSRRAWALAPALVVFTHQLRQVAPGARVDTIGDADHSSRTSDHNPDRDRLVCALDVFDSGALDDGVLARELTDPEHRADWPRISYVINARRIWSPARAAEGWRPYDGPNPHDTHCHLSVTQAGKRHTRPWSALAALAAPHREDDDTMTPQQFAVLRAVASDLAELRADVENLTRGRAAGRVDRDKKRHGLDDVLNRVDERADELRKLLTAPSA